MPPTIVLVHDEADVLRDEGDAYAARLWSGRRRGHDRPLRRRHRADSMMLNPPGITHATRAAVAHAIAVPREALHNVRR
jgi:hypothetical protein